LTAWCFNPREIPSARDLHIAEPPIGEILVPPGKPSLKYTVAFRVTEILQPGAESTDGAASEAEEEDGNGSRRRQRRRAASPSSHGGAAAIVATGRPSARDRLGPDASGASHVACSVEADGSSSQAMRLDPLPVENMVVEVIAPSPEEPAPVFEGGNNNHEEFSVATTDGYLGSAEGDLGLPVGRADSQPLEPSPSKQVCQEQVTDASPSMESPTMVCFAVPSPASGVQSAVQQEGAPL